MLDVAAPVVRRVAERFRYLGDGLCFWFDVVAPGGLVVVVKLGVMGRRDQAVLEVLIEGVPVVEVAARFG